MVKEPSTETSGPPMTPDRRAEAVIRTILGDSLSLESHSRAMIADAISTAIAEERKICAKLLDAIKDEFIDWCAINRISSAEQVQIANMLSKAAAAIREQTRHH